jgi:hypothetical protein
MEALFAPTTRLRDLYLAAREGADDEDDSDEEEEEIDALVELELITGSSVEGFSWSDFYSAADGKIVWITPYVYFHLTGEIVNVVRTEYPSFLTVEIVPLGFLFLYVCARSEADATIASDILLQLLTTSDSRKVQLSNGGYTDRFPVSGLAFSHFLVHSRNLRVLCLFGLALNTSHCRAANRCFDQDRSPN